MVRDRRGLAKTMISIWLFFVSALLAVIVAKFVILVASSRSLVSLVINWAMPVPSLAKLGLVHLIEVIFPVTRS